MLFNIFGPGKFNYAIREVTLALLDLKNQDGHQKR